MPGQLPARCQIIGTMPPVADRPGQPGQAVRLMGLMPPPLAGRRIPGWPYYCEHECQGAERADPSGKGDH
jgi:hypothetical protein